MPIYKNPFEKGKLIVQFGVEFRESKQMAPARIAGIEKYLPPREELIVPDDAEEVTLTEYHAGHARNGTQYQAYESMEDDDEEGVHPGGEVQCGTQ